MSEALCYSRPRGSAWSGPLPEAMLVYEHCTELAQPLTCGVKAYPPLAVTLQRAGPASHLPWHGIGVGEVCPAAGRCASPEDVRVGNLAPTLCQMQHLGELAPHLS